jgi:hypothetical protein
MMEKMDHKPIAEKDMAEAKGLVAKLQMLAEKSGTSVEHLVEMCSDQEGYEEEEGEEEEMGAGPDKGKVALIVAKMKGQQKAEE